MINESVLLIKERTDAIIEQTEAKRQETLEPKLNKQKETFSHFQAENLYEEGKWLLVVTKFEVMNSVFKITDENKSFAITTQSPWISDGSEEIVDKIGELLELGTQNDVELHAKEFEKRCTWIEIQNNRYIEASFKFWSF